MPDTLSGIIENDADTGYNTGNAKIIVYKKKDYMLTSVLSPRNDHDFIRWEIIWGGKEVDYTSNEYVKSLNEKFHGTTDFAPGRFGYQQHFWYAALTSECVVFANHPGTTADDCPMRPGYWYGNGVMPAQYQNGSEIGSIFAIHEAHPIHFTHLYWPTVKFDETRRSQGWIFGRKADSYLAVWCSTSLSGYDDMLFQCEYRAYGSKTAYYCKCSCRSEAGGFDDFIQKCFEIRPMFDENTLELTTDSGFRLIYEAREDCTQFI